MGNKLYFDIENVINTLKERRHAFVSEADFQLEFAWVIKELYPDFKVRLEYTPEFKSSMHIDILLITKKGWIPIELKYKTKGGKVKDGDDEYILANHGAKDVNCYLYLKDLQRIEYIKKKLIEKNDVPFVEGYTVMLTNDLTYLKSSKEDTVYVDFSIHNGAIKTGEMKWGENASEGTKKGHEKPIVLEGKYPIHWKEYKEVGREVEGKYGEFYYTYNKVEGD